MNGNENTDMVYYLQGRSLRAAEIVESHIRRQWEIEPLDMGLLLSDMPRYEESLARFYDGFFAALRAEDPEVIQILGLESRAIQVHQQPWGNQRLVATASAPAIYKMDIERGHNGYVMISPVDYKGRHFAPEDAILVEGAAREALMRRLRYTDFGDIGLLVYGPCEGNLDVPADYYSSKKPYIQKMEP